MKPTQRSGLDLADPRVGDRLLFDGAEWEVTDHSSYWNDAGYRVNEWCCETESVTAYLLKEVGEREQTRWLFTRQIPPEKVTLPGGERLGERARSGAGSSPPEALIHQGQTYRHAETTEGTYEDEPGERVRKTTWDYWDAPRARNLAVEVWADGRIDCYVGAYIEPGQVTLRPAAGESPAPPAASAMPQTGASRATGVAHAAVAARRAVNPFPAAAVAVPVAYLLPFFLGMPFDRCMAFALPVAALVGWIVALTRAPLVGWAVLILAPALAILFWRFPPLVSPIGLASLLAVPAAIVAVARTRGLGGARRAVQYLAVFGVAAPLLALGLYHYFQFAPGPHTLGQWALALGPAALGGLSAVIISWLMLAAWEPTTP